MKTSRYRRRTLRLFGFLAGASLLPIAAGCRHSKGVPISLNFRADESSVIFHYYTDMRDKKSALEQGILVGAGAFAELAFMPSGGESIPEWLAIEWLAPVLLGAESYEASLAAAKRYTYRFEVRRQIDDSAIHELNETPNRLLELSFRLRPGYADMSWSVRPLCITCDVRGAAAA